MASHLLKLESLKNACFAFMRTNLPVFFIAKSNEYNFQTLRSQDDFLNIGLEIKQELIQFLLTIN